MKRFAGIMTMVLLAFLAGCSLQDAGSSTAVMANAGLSGQSAIRNDSDGISFSEFLSNQQLVAFEGNYLFEGDILISSNRVLEKYNSAKNACTISVNAAVDQSITTKQDNIWNMNDRNDLSYYFEDDPLNQTFGQLSRNEFKNAFRAAAAEWMKQANVHFIEKTSFVGTRFSVKIGWYPECGVMWSFFPDYWYGDVRKLVVNRCGNDAQDNPWTYGIVKSYLMHELGHILGLNHEQKRQDAPDSLSREDGYRTGGVLTHGTAFDVDSIMKYGFNSAGVQNAQQNYLSEGDIGIIQYLYGVRQKKVVSGDFDGNGKTDIAVIYNVNGHSVVSVYNSENNSFTLGAQHWADSGASYWDSQKWLSGDFNGDGKDDLVCIFGENNSMAADVYLSDPATQGATARPHVRWTSRYSQGGYWDAMKWLVGDFNGDGKSDLVSIFNNGGYMNSDVHFSEGDQFSGGSHWATGTGNGGYWEGMNWMTGNFTGRKSASGKDISDLVCVFGWQGQMVANVHYSMANLSKFDGPHEWAHPGQAGDYWDGMKWLAGDFDANGKCDLASLWTTTDKLMYSDVHKSVGDGFSIPSRWADAQGGFWAGQLWFAGNFTGDIIDGKKVSDLANFFQEDGLDSIDVHWATRSQNFNNLRFATKQNSYF